MNSPTLAERLFPFHDERRKRRSEQRDHSKEMSKRIREAIQKPRRAPGGTISIFTKGGSR